MMKTMMLFLVAMLGFSALADTDMYIDANNVNFRSDAGIVQYTLRRDSPLRMIGRREGRRGSWLHVVDLKTGKKGWVFAKYATSEKPASIASVSPSQKPAVVEKAVAPKENVMTPAPKEPAPVAKVVTPASTTPASPALKNWVEKETAKQAPDANPPPVTGTLSNGAIPKGMENGVAKNRTSIKKSEINSECVGDPKDPVGVIYLHGWFKPNGADDNKFRDLETANRAELETLAKALHRRIAAPLAPKVHANQWITNRLGQTVRDPGYGMAEWNGAKIHDVEAAAQDACGGAPLEDKRRIVGFSSGAYAVNKMTCRAKNRSDGNYNPEDYNYIKAHYPDKDDRVALGTKGMDPRTTCDDIINVAFHRKSETKKYLIPQLTQAGWLPKNSNVADAQFGSVR